MAKPRPIGPPFGKPWYGESGGPLSDFVYRSSIDDTTGQVELELQLTAEQGQEGGIVGFCWIGWRRRLVVEENERIVARVRTGQVFLGNSHDDPLIGCSASYVLQFRGQGAPVDVGVDAHSNQVSTLSLYSPEAGEVTLGILAQITMRYNAEGAWPDGPVCRLEGAIESVYLDQRAVVGTVEDYKIEGEKPSFVALRS